MSLLRKVKQILSTDPQADAGVVAHPAITVNTDSSASLVLAEGVEPQGYLAGQLLVATPVIDAGPFQKSVIYLFAHSAQGAMGLVINQPVELLNYSTLLQGMEPELEKAMQDIPVYFGGPVERHRGFVLHTSDYFREFSVSRSSELAVTASSAVLKDLAEGAGPRHAALVVGCAGWTAGQLEAEIEQNAWITLPATEALVFGTEDELKWATASKALGISDMTFYSRAVGHA